MEDEKEEKLAWLKRMENGSIGETRTKSILIDRFWILERNVDINGADFLIQRQLMQKDLNNPKPSKFGIVQAKFRESLPARIHIKKDYVSNDGKPRDNFFLFVHTGKENDKKTFFYTAQQLMALLDGEFNFTIDKPYPANVIDSTKVVLDQIEKMLERMDLSENYLSFFSRDASQIYFHKNLERKKHTPLDKHFDVTLPHLGSFYDLTQDAREEAEKFIRDYCDPLVEIINKMNESTDPAVIYDLYEEFKDESRTRGVEKNQDYLKEAIDSYQQIEDKSYGDVLRKICKIINSFIENDITARDENLLDKKYSYQIKIKSKNFLDINKKLVLSSHVGNTKKSMLKAVESHIQSEVEKRKEPRYRSPYYQVFDETVSDETTISISINLSQAESCRKILYYKAEIAKDEKELSYFNPKIELDRSKEMMLKELSDCILLIAINRVFSSVEL